MTTPTRDAAIGATELTAVSKYRFGGTVHSDDGELGRLVYLVADPARRALIAVGVKFGMFGKPHLVPIEQVREATPEDLTLGLTREQIERGKDQPPTQQLDKRTVIVLNGKRIGHLVQLTTNRETHVLRHLIVDRGLSGETVLPARAITGVEGQQITAALEGVGGHQLTPYRPDEELHEEIRMALEDVPRLRVDLPGMEIPVIDGVVWLRGHVASDLTLRLAEERVQGIRGIDELHNDLIADTALAAAVSYALAHDPRTAREHGIGVYPRLGEVYLRGRVRSEAARQAATQVASAVPEVKRLRNELGIDPTAEVIPELASVTNNEDLVPGGR